jgi:GNAT superfamily N-acetyltransferase
MSLEIREVTTPQQRKAFVALVFQLYKGNPYWVPPLKADEVKALTPEHNPAFEFCKAKFWLAYRDGKVVGRIGGILNTAYNQKVGEKLGRFTRLEFVDDPAVADALLRTAEAWARSQGCTHIHGPLGFTNLDHQGMLIEGFDHLPSIASEYHLPYYRAHLERNGYDKEADWVEFRLTIEQQIPEKALKLKQTIMERYGLRIVHFKKTKEMYPWGQKVFNKLNEAFGELFSFAALNPRMVDYYINRYFKLLNPSFVKLVVDKDNEVAGFIISLPSLSRAMQKANGSLWPLGWWHILQAWKHPTEADLLLTGIDPKLQGRGVPALLITELQQVMVDHGVRFVETTGMLESNTQAIQTWKNYEHIQHKRKRCFRKAL